MHKTVVKWKRIDSKLRGGAHERARIEITSHEELCRALEADHFRNLLLFDQTQINPDLDQTSQWLNYKRLVNKASVIGGW